MDPSIVSIILLCIIFVVGTVLPINIGSLAFAGTFILVVLAKLPINDVMAAFPSNLFTLLVGITYMFAIAQNNGTMRVITNSALRLIRGNVAIIPWAFHIIAILLSGIGAGPAASTAILAPIAMSVAVTANINPFLMGVMLVHGSHGGSLFPISPIALIVNGASAKAGLPDVSTPLFLNGLAINILIAIGAYCLLGGIGLIRRVREEQTKEAGTQSESTLAFNDLEKVNWIQIATLVGIVLLLVLGIGFKLDIGLTAFTIGIVLALLSPGGEKKAVEQVSWSVVLMVSGILTYVGVMQKVGGMALIGNALSAAGSPQLSIMLIAAVGAITSLFSATGAVLGATIPLLAQVLGTMPALSNVAGAVSSLAIASCVVDTSPMSLQGAVILGTAQENTRKDLFRQLLLWGVAMVFVGTIVPWLLFVILGIP